MPADVPFLFKHFGDVANSFVQNISHACMDPPHFLFNKVVFVHIGIWCLNGTVHILEGHVQKQWLFWVMKVDYLFHSLKETKRKKKLFSVNSSGLMEVRLGHERENPENLRILSLIEIYVVFFVRIIILSYVIVVLHILTL